MHALYRSLACLMFSGLLACLSGAAAAADAPVAPRDGAHDFDFEFGTWKTHVRRLMHPLSPASKWVEYDGSSVVSRVWGGRANLVELEVDGPAGHLEFLSLRLYDPDSHQWSLNVASGSGGGLGVPTVGGFSGGRGEFYDHESFGGRAIVVRFVITPRDRDTVHFEQAFSADDGKTWELNWVADDTRVKGGAGAASLDTSL